MAKLIVKALTLAEWGRAASHFEDLSLLQPWEYAESKAQTSSLHAERGVFLDGEKVVGVCQALVRRLPLIGGGLVWINRASLWRTHDGEGPPCQLLALLAELRRYYAEGQGMSLRAPPPISETDFDLAAAESAGYGPAGSVGWASTILDFEPDEKTLRGNLGANNTNEGSKLNAGQYLLWAIIRKMKAKGLRSIDLSGMDPNLTPEGIYKFNQGVDGEPYRLAPELETGCAGVVGRLVRWRGRHARANG